MFRRISVPSLLIGATLGALAALAVLLVISYTRDTSATATFDAAYRIVRDRYVRPEQTDPTKLVHDAIRGMVEGLGDTGHSRFLSQEQLQRERQSLSGRFVGIGVEMGERDGRPVVVTAFPGSPAAEAGVRAGDRFLRIDNEDVSALPLEELRPKLRGAAGSSLRVTMLRPDTTTFEATLRREELRLPFVTYAPLENSTVWHIYISSFGEDVSKQLDQALAAAKAGGATGIVLDLRDDPGGLLDEAVKVVSRFVPSGVVLIERDRSGTSTPVMVKEGVQTTDLPLTLLINSGSASAAEVTAAALLYHNRATAVGATTFGTATVLQTFGLPDGSALLLGVREWLTPAGEPLRGRGVTPTEPLPLPRDVRPLIPRVPAAAPEPACTTTDVQLRAAAARLGQTC